jgi:murein DD-endopeptidase MepM/ murein hydrolase activator NlpD
VRSINSPNVATGGRSFSRGAGVAILLGMAVPIAAMTAATALPTHRATPPAGKISPAPRASAYRPEPPQPSPARETQIAAQRFTGRVGENLSNSLLAAGVPEPQGRQYVALLGRAIELANGLSVDDRFDLVIERRPDGKLGQLLYVGLDRVARADVELLKWTDGRNVIWVNADGVGGDDNSGLGLPVHGRLTSGFGERFHPILGYKRFHKGVDLAAAAGTPIVAAADGRVVSAGWHGGYGQLVQIAHVGGLETNYGHMSRIAARIGEVVRKGEVIGYVGSTGLSTGPHLHFEVTRNGQPVNPMSVKMSAGPGHLEGEKLHAFQSDLRGLLLLPNAG